MNITRYVIDKMNDCPEYYPYEWFAGCKLLLKQINDGLIVDTAEKIALKEYSAIFKVTAKISYCCKSFDEREQLEIKQESEKLYSAIADIISNNS